MLVHPDDAKSDYLQIDADFARREAAPVTVRCVTKDGHTRWFSWTGACDPEDVEGTMRLILPLLLHGMRGAGGRAA